MLDNSDLRDMSAEELVDLRPVCHRDNVTATSNDFIRFNAGNRKYVVAVTVNVPDIDVVVSGFPRENLASGPAENIGVCVRELTGDVSEMLSASVAGSERG